MLRLSVALLLLLGSVGTSIAQAPAMPPILSAGIELCLRNGHSNEQYRDKLAKLGALPVPEEQRKLSEKGLNSKEEWSFAFNGTSYLTSFLWANTFCGVLGPADKKAVVAAVTGPSLKFTYYGMAAGDASQDIYRGQFDGEASTIMIASHRSDEVFLVFAIDKMWDVFSGRAKWQIALMRALLRNRSVPRSRTHHQASRAKPTMAQLDLQTSEVR